MLVECEAVSQVVKPVKAFVYDNIRDYVGHIKNYDKNLSVLRKNLSEVCTKKDNIIKQVNEGKGNQHEITREADSWLKLVRTLAGDEKLKSLMYEDVETAKVMMRLMGKSDLKKLVRQDGEMQKLVVKVMNKLKEEMENSKDEDRLIATVDYNMVDYKMVAEVVVEVMKDTTEEFKKLMKKDKKMAVIATRMLIDTDLDKLTKDDMEMEDIVREAGSVNDEGLCKHGADEDVKESSVLRVPGVDENTVRESVSKLLIPLGNLRPIIGELMNDSVFKNALPKSEDVKLGWDVVNGLLLKNREFRKAMDENIKQQESCSCFCAFALSHYRNQYKMSITAETIAERIKKDMIDTSQGFPLTVRTRSFDLKRTPTQFLKGLQSRDRLLQEILQILRDDQVDAVGVFGMGGCGKTTLAKEVACKCVDMFSIVVEISECPDIKRIQGTIAESIDLHLHNVQNVGLRAKKLYNGLISEKEKKILIILDNIWEKLNLDDVGIPSTCKLLLTTREKEVCRLMGVRDPNVRGMGLLNGIEAKGLFKSQVGDNGGREEYKAVTDRLLRKCGGLPLAIVVTANALKNKDLPYWRKFADGLEKPISGQLASGDHRATYSILATSYRFVESKEKKMFFILCCLRCFGSDTPIKAVMRYGIGLNLFQHVNKLSEAMDQANRWADELVSSSMLLKSDREGFLKIHDVVRAFGISFAAKDEHKLLVDAIPRWMDKETLTEYTAICLLSDNDYSGLTGMESDKLQILLLDCTKIPDSPSSFSGRMLNLKVLYLGNMNFHPKLPESIGELVKLRTVSLEKCKFGDIEVIGELVNLRVLSFFGSHLKELPNEIGKLINLRLLDLTDCIFKSPPDLSNILGGLSELEGLFMCDIFEDHMKYNQDVGKSYAPLAIEFNNLHYLNALEMQIWCAQQLSVDAQFVKNLDSFRLRVCYRWGNLSQSPQVGSFRRILDVEEVDMGEYLGDNTLKSLLKKADWLKLSYSSNFGILFDELHNEGLPELRYLSVDTCIDVAFIFNLKENLLVFPNLHTLSLHRIPEVKGFCDGEDSPGVFTNLQDLSLSSLSDLQYVLPFGRAPCKLTTLKVRFCESLKFIFTENAFVGKEETDVMELPFLKLLDVFYLDNLISLLGSENLSGIGDGVEEYHQVFFNPRIVFSALEEFSLMNCKRVVKLWDKELGISSLQRLTTITITSCEELSSLGSLSIFTTLVQLERLIIGKCKSMHEVITSEGTEESEEGDQEVIFPQLMDLFIRESGNLKSFYGGRCQLKFPKLKRLRLFDLDCLNKFAGSENQSFLFQKEMDFPCLEELRVSSVSDDVMGLWDWHLEGGNSLLLNPVPRLKTLRLDIKGCSQIPSIICKNLSSLAFEMCDDEVLLSLGNERSVWTYFQLRKLKDLHVYNSKSLKDLLRKEDFNVAAALMFCKQLVNLNLSHLPRLKIFPLHLFKSLCSLELGGLSWDYAFSADTFVRIQESLQQLETLDIRDCENMRVVIQVDEEDVGLVFKFPRLKIIRLYSSSVIGFSTTTNATLRLPFLEAIDVCECDMIQHFWSGPIIAPKLEEVIVNKCKTIKLILVGNPNHMVELPSLMRVWLSRCPDVLCFSSGPVTAPNLRDIRSNDCSQMQSFSPGTLLTPNLDYAKCEREKYFMADFGMNLNHLLRSRHDIDYSEELNAIFDETNIAFVIWLPIVQFVTPQS